MIDKRVPLSKDCPADMFTPFLFVLVQLLRPKPLCSC